MPEMRWDPERSSAVQSGGDTNKRRKPPACAPAEPPTSHVRGCGTMPETRRHPGPDTSIFDRRGIGPGLAAYEMGDRNAVPKPASDRHTERRRAPSEMKTPE